jgi:predicted ArsR family transcriptional regulator
MYHTLERKYLELAVQSPAQFALYFDNINAKKTEDSELESFLEKYWKREGSLWRDLLPHNARDGACVQKIVRFYRINHYLAAYKKEASLE